MNRVDKARSAVAQSLPPAGEQAVRTPIRDWSGRQRLSVADALRYSRFVAFMKNLLPIAAVVVLASVVAYSVIPRHQDKMSVAMSSAGNLKNDLTMTKASFTGADERVDHFNVTFAEAVQDPKNLHRADLRQVQADMEFDNANWLSASAGHGALDWDAGTLRLDKGISAYTDTGYELHTQSADVFIKKDVVIGKEKVRGHGPLGQLSADRFTVDRLHKQVNLSGHVHMRMYPNKAKKR